ncbi:MAG TPA: hypothetical protein DGH68_08785, partial [Bacteroidetes bacterium]|nr:hypothetical protein [Bacteroidota bacterium]
MHRVQWRGLRLCFIALLSTSANAQQDSTGVADSLLIQTLQQQLSQVAPPPAAPVAPRSAPSTNPNMSVIGDFRMSYQSPAHRHIDAEFHEAEIAVQSVVDPYARADFFFSVARDPLTGKFGLDLEEGYLTSLDLPAALQLKAGKFRSMFGKINNIHPHALPFIDVPNVYVHYLGDDGLNDEGLSLSWLIPNPLDFYQELTIEATRGPDDNPNFVRSEVDRYLYLGHLKNFWDLTDNATLELGLSAASGQNDSAFASVLGGIDLTYKWKPLQFNTYQSLVLQAEAIWSSKRLTETETVKSWGMYALATYQIGKRWFLTGRFDYSNLPDNASFVERAYSGVLGWYATEFQKIELEYKGTTSNVLPT